METIWDRTAALLGWQAVETLKSKAVIVFGIGGVGGFVVEALARTAVGRIGLVDFDLVAESNRNRQVAALGSTLGLSKAAVMAERVRDINPEACTEVFNLRLTQQTLPQFRLGDWDYVVDAIDDVPAKLLLIGEAKALGVPIISAMGAGNKLDPCGFRVADISKTHTCPLARVIRREVGKAGLGPLKVVFSPEEPRRAAERPLVGVAGAVEAGGGRSAVGPEAAGGRGAVVAEAAGGRSAVGPEAAGGRGAVGPEAGGRSAVGPEAAGGRGAVGPEAGGGRSAVVVEAAGGRRPPGSLVFAVGAAGLLLASEVVKDLLQAPQE